MKGDKKIFLIVVLGFILFFSMFFISNIPYVFAIHNVTIVDGSSKFSIDDNTNSFFNISINNTDTGPNMNISQVNITIPSGANCSFIKSTANSSAIGVFSNNSNILSWTNSTGKLILNASDKRYFWFNLTCQVAGNYNFVITTMNGTNTLNNLSLEINDTATFDGNLTWPTNSSTVHRTRVFNLSFLTTTGVNLNCSTFIWHTNGTVKESSSNPATVPTGGSGNYNVNGINDGTYKWNVYCYNVSDKNDDLWLNSSDWIFSVDYDSWIFNGTVYDTNGRTLEGAVINLTYYQNTQFGPSVVSYTSATTNGTGWFGLNATGNSSYMYTPVITYTNSTTGGVQYVGQALPQFPYFEFSSLSNLNFYLEEAGTLNLTCVNLTGGMKRFGYIIKDTLLGYPIAEDNNANVSQKTIYVPKNRNYSIMVMPDESFPLTIEWTNFSSTNDYTFADNLSDYNTTTATLSKKFNASEKTIRVTGYLNKSFNWTYFRIIPFALEGGNTIFLANDRDLSIPYNLSAWAESARDQSDNYTLNKGFYNASFFNISLIGPVESVDYVLFVTAIDNNSRAYGGYRNLSLSWSSSEIQEFNFSSMLPLMGNNLNTITGNLSMSKASGSGSVNISSSQQLFKLVNASNPTQPLSMFAHVKTTLDYSDYGCEEEFSFISDIDQTDGNASFKLPLLNASVKEMEIFSQSFAPKRIGKRNADALIKYPNISMSAFSPGDIGAELSSSQISITIYKSNSTCNAPGTLASGCSLQSSASLDSFNPLESIIEGGDLIFEMGVSDVLIRYINVDLLASGPPSGLFDDNDDVTESTSGGFSKAMRFGSDGPSIYDYVIVSFPYTQGVSGSQSGLDESKDVNVSIPYMYGENESGEMDWNDPIWDTSVNGTTGSALAGNHSHYLESSSEWETLMSENTCTINTTEFNSTNPCYIDKTANRIWMRLPHFSGTKPSISGNSIVYTSSNDDTTTTTESTGGGSSAAGWAITFTASLSELENENGYTKKLGISNRVKFKISNNDISYHSVGIKEISDKTVKIEVASTPQTATLSIGDERRFDVDDDGEYYDVYVKLNAIEGTEADLTIKKINEKITDETIAEEEEKEEKASEISEGQSQENEEKSDSNLWIWIIILVLIIIAGVVIYLVKNSNKK